MHTNRQFTRTRRRSTLRLPTAQDLILCACLVWALPNALACDDDPIATDAGGDVVSDIAADVDDDDDSLAPDSGDLAESCPTEDLVVSEAGIGFWQACPHAFVELLPSARVGGRWVGGGIDSPCTASGTAVMCGADPYGTVLAEALDDSTVVVRFEASQSVAVEALALSGPAWLDGATAWLSNGFQSWSQSGAIALGPAPDEATLEAALTARGDAEVGRTGRELSWFYTAAGGGDYALVAGALSAEVFKPWAQVSTDEAAPAESALTLRLVAGGTGESVTVGADEAIEGPPWRVELGDDLEAMLDRYGRALPHREPASADAGWNSWYELWDDVDEAAVRANAAIASEILGDLVPSAAPPLRIVIDDGWQMAWGEWEPNGKFPSGMDGLASDLGDDGFSVGIWLAPFLVDADSDLVTTHPDWLVAGATYDHLTNGPMRVLDVTHPEVQEHLSGVIERIVSWGYDLLKIDFLFAGTWEGERHEDVTGLQAFHIGMQIIREAAGDDTVLLAVGSPPVATFPWAEAWRLGGDIALEVLGASWFFVPNQARSIASRWHLCRAVLCDADPPLLRDLPQNEVEVGAWVVALAGGALFLSDDLRILPEERRSWGLDEPLVALALGGEPSIPSPFFPADPPQVLSNPFTDHLRGESGHVVPSLWLAPDGRRIAINFGDEPLDVDATTVSPRSVVVLDAQ